MASLDYGDYQDLVDKKKQILFKSVEAKLGKKSLVLIELAFEVASRSHFNQNRKSGEPYITHPTEVATIICDWNLDEQTIASALLHDVVEDTEITKMDIEQMFGKSIAELVDGVTKLEKIHFESEEIAHAEYFQKVILAMSKDIRVILIKLADRLHNMLTLGNMKEEKRKRIALETMEIYVPLANKIGLHKVHLQLADESFKYLHPYRYLVLSKAVDESQKKRLPLIETILENISTSLKANGISATFVYRQRTIYNLYRRMQRRRQSFDRIYDSFEVKVVVESIRDCYLVLGVLHNLYRPFPGKFKDYIAIPKSNGYQSLHSTLMGPHGTPIQLHIRTTAMEDVAENGIISHWIKKGDHFLAANSGTASWINNILDIQSSSFSANEFLNNLKHDLSPSDIYTFTPKGKIILLPQGSTVLDFAYYIHSDIGNHCESARINQYLAKLDTKLQNGDIVEITTNENVEPNDDWLQMVVSGKSISKIKHYLKEQKYDDAVNNGIKLINQSLSLLGSDTTLNDQMLKELTMKYYPKLDSLELEHAVGNGNISTLMVAKQILGILPDQVISIPLSKCQFLISPDIQCSPLPGETLLGRINRQGELVLHKQTCKNIKAIELDKYTFVHIINDTDKQFSTHLTALIANEPGTFSKFAHLISESGINILELNQGYQSAKTALITATLSVNDLSQAENLLLNLRNADFIWEIKLL
ncbi:MAG: guanosine-3,5-bis(diphosphate) 3-pyrophosphohydrolase [Burkholderiales bacterium]|jgi:GTP pyrophosphokinase/guanosine-3',5'-bis(diphosphate) 3'-pyrophosphohydrolase|nr:guanosine-3,5-bis(diphosphate) 3-pyrophosphohydrolase [Burkholderiales bacterium]